MVVRYPSEYRDNIDQIKNLKVAVSTSSGTNAYIPLSELADISLNNGAAWIYHESTERYIPIKFSVRDRDLTGAVAEAQQRIKAHVSLPSGYRYVWAGEFQDYEAAKNRLEIISLVSLALIGGLLYSLFNSVRDSLLALAGIPQAMVGGIIALYVTHQHFSISAAVGFISLFGVSVMLGILIMSYYKEDRRTGREPREAMYHSAKRLLRPLLMTALSACIGLLPAAISTGIGSQVQRPFATVIVGGMLIGPLMLLVAIPALRIIFPDKNTGESILSAEEVTV